MKYTLCLLIMFNACTKKENSIGIIFDENNIQLNAKVLNTVKSFNFYVIYQQPNEITESYKIFGMTKESGKDIWYKIDFINSQLTRRNDETVFVDYVVWKPLKSDEAVAFLQSLAKFDLFKLKKGKELSDDCAKEINMMGGYRETMDAPSISIQVQTDSMSFSRLYYDPFEKSQKCSNKLLWRNILSIDSVFTNDWIKSSFKLAE